MPLSCDLPYLWRSVIGHPGTAMTDPTLTTLLPLTLGVAGALLGAVTLALPKLRRSILPASLIILVPLLMAASWWQQSRSRDHQPDSKPRADYRIELREAGSVTAVTDRGRRIRLGTLGRPVSDADLFGVENDHIRTHELN